MNQPYQDELDLAVQAVRQAAGLCCAVQSQIAPDVLEKKDRSPVTVADFGSQALVCRALAEALPKDPVIAEEDAAALRSPDQQPLLDQVVGHVREATGQVTADQVCGWIDHGGASEYCDRYWTLDPIDGTKGFLRKEQYAVALGLVIDGQVTVAALAAPNLTVSADDNGPIGAIFTAVRGSGACVQPLDDDGSALPIHVSDTSDSAAARFCESVEAAHSAHGHAAAIAEQLRITAPPVRLDSQAKYAIVARGQADIYMRLPTRADYVEKIWDHAAGSLIVTEAGGCVTDMTGKALEFTHGSKLHANRGFIVTNSKLHDAVLNALKRTNPST